MQEKADRLPRPPAVVPLTMRALPVAPAETDAVQLTGLAEAHPGDLDAGVLLESTRLADLDLPPANLAGAELVEVALDAVTGDDLDLTGARLREVLLSGVRFTSLRAGRGDWQDAQVSGRFGVLDAQGARWRSVMLTGCKVDLLSLRGAEVDDLLLTDDCRQVVPFLRSRRPQARS